ncbi:MAG: C4-dicarboxylate ABC transporter permease [Thermoprotei archaeon]|nr:MAG: C4-dicarboxylate ABC transporter permease [Thermoprotei archaeon]
MPNPVSSGSSIEEEVRKIEEMEIGRGRRGKVLLIVFILGLFITFVEIGFVMNYNFMLYNLLASVGLVIEPLRWVPSIQQNMALVLGAIFTLAFILYPISKKVRSRDVPWYDWVLAVIASLGPFYIFYYFPQIAVIGYPEATLINVFFATLTLLCLLEATRRVLGPVLPAIVLVFVIYALWQADFNTRPVLNHLYFEAEGIFSIPLLVMVTYVFAFLFFGSFLENIGVGQYITDLMISVFGRRPGGPAKSAVISSALMGTVSGSSVANVLTTGTFTIPLMKKAGFPPEVAGAVEPAASTGGQLMPPIMGAAAFVMAQFLGRPYREIIIAAAIPAVLYFTSIYVFIDRETKRLGLAGLSTGLPPLKPLLKKIYLLAPIGVITYVLLIGIDPQYAVMASISSAFLASIYANERMSIKDKLGLTLLLAVLSIIPIATGITKGKPEQMIAQALYFGSIMTLLIVALVGVKVYGMRWLARAVFGSIDRTARASVGVFLAAASAGVIQGVLTYTGLATTLGYKLVELAAGNLLLLLVFTMLISLVLGMGVPTTANYIITSTIAAPAIVLAATDIAKVLGTDALYLTAHMFVFYFGILADVTPPVALAAYAGATLARSHFWRTALNASKYALAGYIIPYIFTQHPEMLLVTVNTWTTERILSLVIGVVACLATIILLSSALTGWLNGHLPKYFRAVLLALGIACITTNVVVIAIALATYVAIYIIQGRLKHAGKTK